jgi:prephenate dehydrogenase
MEIAVVGLGLIGGSIAIDLNVQVNVHVLGVESVLAHREIALQNKIVDEIVEINFALGRASVVIVAVPVDKIEQVLPYILDRIDEHQIVIDVGSTKGSICQAIRHHRLRSRFVAAHPLAGTEFSGPSAAMRGLFIGKKNIICEPEFSDKDALDMALQIFQSLGANTTFMTADDHDKHLAYVSHLSHVSSFMLGLTVLDIEKDENQIFDLASTGFESTVRLAKSNPKTWSAIFSKNKDHLIVAMDSYIEHLQNFKEKIQNNDIESLEALMEKSNEIKRILKPSAYN